MSLRYLAVPLLTSLLLLGAAPHHAPLRRAPPGLYSARALRRARSVLQLRLLELRKQRLERVLHAIQCGFPANRILQIPS
ncbi:MAG: hypothetical protein ABR508_01755 [Candidatus Baltobacteraceae bacterium]